MAGSFRRHCGDSQLPGCNLQHDKEEFAIQVSRANTSGSKLRHSKGRGAMEEKELKCSNSSSGNLAVLISHCTGPGPLLNSTGISWEGDSALRVGSSYCYSLSLCMKIGESGQKNV